MQQLQQGITLQNGKYTIERVLGQGGFGITYLAEQTMLNRKVAIKEFFLKELCIRKDGTSVSVSVETQADMVERYKIKFTKEAQILARFNSPNIVHVLDIFNENDTWYYVMDYVEGRSLDAIIKERGHLEEDESLNYLHKIANALSYIHGFKVNHLDIKPSNIMVRSSDNEPILIDFGISKQYDEKKNETSTTPPGISDGYSPLEQYKAGGVSTFSPQADIYALGATLYKMLTGITPPSASDVLNEGLQKSEFISESIMMAIEKAMQPKKVDRPATVEAFLALLHCSKSKVQGDLANHNPTHEINSETPKHSKKTEIKKDFNKEDDIKVTSVKTDNEVASNEYAKDDGEYTILVMNNGKAEKNIRHFENRFINVGDYIFDNGTYSSKVRDGIEHNLKLVGVLLTKYVGDHGIIVASSMEDNVKSINDIPLKWHEATVVDWQIIIENLGNSKVYYENGVYRFYSTVAKNGLKAFGFNKAQYRLPMYQGISNDKFFIIDLDKGMICKNEDYRDLPSLFVTEF